MAAAALQDAIMSQATKIAEDCERAAIRDALLSGQWNAINLWLGLSAALAAALSAALAGAEFLHAGDSQRGGLYSGAAAIIASVATAVLTFLKPSEKAASYQQYSNKYHALRDRIRSFVAIVPHREDPDVDPLGEFEKLLQEKRQIDAEHPILPEWAYRKAHEKMKAKLARKREFQEMQPARNESAGRDSGLMNDQ
ncbi:SLATT domain-containing protein [Aurantimonas aggregata]|uniref:SLATT domain-containing protein n=1 Tax=Aurantimonas aggregata TaxID=2047720 RepID=A0A6L9ME89_9HYPH|nr:SLATT domain-containing protein [Aurantimonas aggregata]NDV86105.1 SLATT domain-containing protein [Aurantimonas aggregata]